MRRFLFHGDKTTAKDEGYLLLFILICIAIGVLLIVFAPKDWIISQGTFVVLGALCILTGAMFIPGFIYRLVTNDKPTHDEKK